MREPALYLGEGLDVLARQLLSDVGPTGPLDKVVVAVPNPQIGQWLEQFVAREQGVLANWSIQLLDDIIAESLYENPDDFQTFSVRSLGIAMLAQRDDDSISVNSAFQRAKNLREVLLWRPENLEAYLAHEDNQIESLVMRDVARRGVHTPWERFDAAPTPPRRLQSVAFFGVRELPHGRLLPRTFALLATHGTPTAYIPVADIATKDSSDHTLGSRWLRVPRAHLQFWRDETGCTFTTLEGSSPHTTSLRDAFFRGVTSESYPTLSWHGAVGASRQVEIARDLVLREVAAHGCAPHRVRVVTTNADQFAPLFAAHWAPRDEGRPFVQYEIADQTLPRASSRQEAALRLLRVVDSHHSVEDLATLLAEPALRRGLGIDATTADRVRDLARTAVTIGLNESDRAPLALSHHDRGSGTWQRFVDRGALATVFETTSDARAPLWTLGVPSDIDGMVAVASLITVVQRWQSQLGLTRPLSDWMEDLSALSESIIGRERDVIDNGLDKIHDRLQGALGTANPTMPFSDFRDLVEYFAGEARGGSTFGRGGVTVMGIDELADAEYDVTVILGLDDTFLPRIEAAPIHLGAPQPGDPSHRQRFRSALLATLLTTSKKVFLVSTDRSVRDGSPILPAVPVADLWSALGVTSDVMRRHPRHGFSTIIATPGVKPDLAGHASDAVSLDPTHASVATLLFSPGAVHVNAPFLSPDPSVDVSIIDIAEIGRFYRSPLDYFVRRFFHGATDPDSVLAIPEVLRRSLMKYPEVSDLKRWIVDEVLASRVPDETHADATLSLLPDAFHAAEISEHGLADVRHFADAHRRNLSRLPATVRRADTLYRDDLAKCGVNVPTDLRRTAIDVYELEHTSLMVQHTTASSIGSRVPQALLHLSLMTLHDAVVGRQASAEYVLAWGKVGGSTTTYPQFVRFSWPDGADALALATDTLDILYSIYQFQGTAFPLYFPRTTWAQIQAMQTDTAYKNVFARSKDAKSTWEGDQFREITGEGAERLASLLFPEKFVDLRNLRDDDYSFMNVATRLSKVVTSAKPFIGTGTVDWLPEVLR